MTCFVHSFILVLKTLKLMGNLVTKNQTSTNLTSDERVKHILNKIDFYGVCNNKFVDLFFAHQKQKARELSIKLNQHGRNVPSH